jgi:hypothetical protein
MITRLAIYDFDGTLMDTPHPDQAAIWEERTGNKITNKDWWGSPESLDLDVFNIQPFGNVLRSFYNDMARSDTYTVIIGARVEELRPEITKICDFHAIKPHEILLKTNHRTGKDERTRNLIDRLVFDIEEVVIYEDREKEFKAYSNFKQNNPDLRVTIYKADQGNLSLLESFNSIVSVIQEEIDRIK